MTWATNPLFTPDEHGTKTTTGIETQLQQDNKDTSNLSVLDCEDWKLKAPTDHFTRGQAIYVFILNGLVAAALGAGINFGIAYATYHTQDAVRLFVLPNALAADAGFTLLAQFITTWLSACFLVNFHLRKGSVASIGFFHEPKNGLMRWYFFLDQKQPQELNCLKLWLTFILANTIRSLILLAVFFPVAFGASIGFLTLVGRHRGADWYFDVVWAPQVFKLIFGVAVGSTCTPVMAAFWLVRCGWVLKARVGERGVQPVGQLMEV